MSEFYGSSDVKSAVSNQIRKLALPVRIDSGEGLREAAFRACLWNGFPRSRVVLSLAECTSVHKLSALAGCDSRADLHKLARVLGIGIGEHALRLEERPPTYASRDFVSFFGHSVRRSHISRTRRLAPQVLARTSMLKAIWSLKPLPWDPVSREFLRDRCPSCDALLGWDCACDGWICDQCALDLRDVPEHIYEPKDEKAFDFVVLLLDPESANRKISHSCGGELSNESEGDLFQFAVRIAQTCQRVETPRHETSLGPHHLERAGRAILDWPQGFMELVDEKIAMSSNGRELGWFNSKPLRRLQFDPTLSVAIRARIKSLFDCSRRAEALRHRDFANLKIPETAASTEASRLKHPRSALLKLIKERDDKGVDDFAESWHRDPTMTAFRDICDVRRFSETLGLPVPEVWRLYQSGLAPELSSAITGLGRNTDFKIKESLTTKLAEAVRPGMGSGALSLVSCRFALDPSLKGSWPSILQAILEGRFEVWRGPRSKRGLIAELFVNDFACLRSVVGEGAPSSEVRNVPISHGEVSMIIDRARSIATKIIRAGLMSGVPTIGKFAELRKSWVFSFELKTLAAIVCHPIANAHRKLQSAGIKRTSFGDMTFWQRDEAISHLGLNLDN